MDVLVGRRGVHQLEAPLPSPALVLQRNAFHLRKRRVVFRVPRHARGACGQRLEGVRPALAAGDAHRYAVPALGVGLAAPGGLAVGEDRDRGARCGHAPDEAPGPHERGQLHRGLGELLVDVADQVVVALATLRVVQGRVALQPAVLGRPHRELHAAARAAHGDGEHAAPLSEPLGGLAVEQHRPPQYLCLVGDAQAQRHLAEPVPLALGDLVAQAQAQVPLPV